MNTNSNSYTLIYASTMVVVVAFLLAFAASALRPVQEKNVALDKKKQILAALNIRSFDTRSIEDTYAAVITADRIINANGETVKAGEAKDQDGFKLEGKEVCDAQLPLYVCQIDGQTKYVFPVTGRGLWGGLWGYIALNADLRTVYGAYFSHESETAGLGSLIAEEAFQDQFQGKEVFADSTAAAPVALTVVKKGKVEADKDAYQVDGVTGATLTTNGVAEMVNSGLQRYANFLHANQN